MSDRRRAIRHVFTLLEPLESRTLLSASVALFILQQPDAPVRASVFDADTPAYVPASSEGRPSAVDIQLRFVPGGMVVSVAVSSANVLRLIPGGTVELSDGGVHLGTVALGRAQHLRPPLAPGSHTLAAVYSGDTLFAGGSASETVQVPDPSPPPSGGPEGPNEPAVTYPTNDSGERIRPRRMLSRINFFDANNFTVAAIPTPPSDGDSHPNSASDTSLNFLPEAIPGGGGAVITIAAPTPRFAHLTFSVKMPRLSGAKIIGP